MRTSTVRIYGRDEDGLLDPTFQPVELTTVKGALSIPVSIRHGDKLYDLQEVIKTKNVITEDPDYFCYYMEELKK